MSADQMVVSGSKDEELISAISRPQSFQPSLSLKPGISMTSALDDDEPPASHGYPSVDSLYPSKPTSRRSSNFSTTSETSYEDGRIGIRVSPNFDHDGEPPASTSFPPVSRLARPDDFPDDLPTSPSKSLAPLSRRPDPPSLTLSIFHPDLPWRQRILSILASLGINLFLPFVNGVMLGFGEIFAREYMSIWFGIGPHTLPGVPMRVSQKPASTVAQVGLRAAAEQGGGNVKPGHPAAKTAFEAVADLLTGKN